MIKKLLIPFFLLLIFQGFGQASTDKYRSVFDSTGTIKAYYLTSDTSRINNAALLPPGTAITLFDEAEKPIGQYILNDVRVWVFTLNKKP